MHKEGGTVFEGVTAGGCLSRKAGSRICVFWRSMISQRNHHRLFLFGLSGCYFRGKAGMEGTLTLTAAVSNHPFSWCYSVVIVQIPLDAETGLGSATSDLPKVKKSGEEEKYDRALWARCHFCL